MAFKKQKWMKYGASERIIEITIKDEMNNKIDFFKCNNNEALKKIIRVIHYKYGFDFYFNPSENTHI